MHQRGTVRQPWTFLLGAIGLAALMMTPSSVLAGSPGTLDPSFGKTGLAWVDFGDMEGANSLFRDSHGRLVLAGDSQQWMSEGRGAWFALARLTPDGKIDGTYANNGRTLLDPTPSQDIASAAAMGPDDKVIVLGLWGVTTAHGYVMVRFMPTGKVDRSFGQHGVVTGTFDAGASTQTPESVAVQPNGRIVVLGEADGVAVLRRYLPSGRVDDGFGGGGRISIPGANSSKLLVEPSGGLIVVWSTYRKSPRDASPSALRAKRFTAAGKPDPSFGVDGLARLKVGPADFDSITVGAVALGAEGRLVVAGRIWRGFTSDGLVVAATANGTSDTTFSGGGWRRFDIGELDRLTAVLGLPDGRVVVGGGCGGNVWGDPSTSPGHAVVIVLHADGSLDSSFGGTGIVVSDIKHGNHPPGADVAGLTGLLVTGDRLVVGGYSGGDHHSDFLAGRYFLGRN